MRNIVHVSAELRPHLESTDVFSALMNLTGKAFRDVPGRKTIQVTLGDKSYFVKQHFGVGWREIFKNLLSLKKPILSAMTEVKAIRKVTELGIATTPLVAYGERGCNPASIKSFVVTEDLGDIISLEDLCADWKENPPNARFKRNLIIAAAKVAKKIHENGVNHRDFYLCHLCLDKAVLNIAALKSASTLKVSLYLIDLHRVLIQATPSLNANMKDIAALYFSSMDIGLTARDYLRFKQHYLNQDKDFWSQVETRAQALHTKFNSKKFQARLQADRVKLD